jgi:hypothetical protein
MSWITLNVICVTVIVDAVDGAGRRSPRRPISAAAAWFYGRGDLAARAADSYL